MPSPERASSRAMPTCVWAAGSRPSAPRSKADLVDRLHVAVRPVILGRGGRLWDGLRGLDERYTVTTEVAERGVIHVTYTR